MICPTNDPGERFNPKCSVQCECGIALCVTKEHQDWTCLCGHGRLQHKLKVAWYRGAPSNHPHPCGECECGCENLIYFTAEDSLRELIELETELTD